MVPYISSIPPWTEFFPPTPPAYHLLFTIFKSLPLFCTVQWIPQVIRFQAMGRSSASNSRLNLPGRYAWAVAELIGPLNMLFIIYTLPSRLVPHANSPPRSSSSSSLLGTGMPFFYHEMLALLYLTHYLNRAIITPLFLAPSMSPIAFPVAILMAIFQFLNSSCLASWIVYDSVNSLGHSKPSPSHALWHPLLTNTFPLVGAAIFFVGLYGNFSSEQSLFTLRRQAARRKAKSEGKPLHNLSFAKVYVIPESEGWFKYILYPHYVMEWLEWTGYWVVGGLAGLGWVGTPAMWFVVNEVATMTPRAVDGRRWYEGRFGKRAVKGRAAVVPGVL